MTREKARTLLQMMPLDLGCYESLMIRPSSRLDTGSEAHCVTDQQTDRQRDRQRDIPRDTICPPHFNSLVFPMHPNAPNPLHTFPRKFPVDGETANLLRTCYGETGVMDFGL